MSTNMPASSITSLQIDEQTIGKRISSGKPVEIQIAHASEDAKLGIRRILHVILTTFDRDCLRQTLEYVLNEMVSNADKANMKRLFFLTENLDITDAAEYRDGMKKFAATIDNNYDKFGRMLAAEHLFTKVTFMATGSLLRMSVRNNATPTPQELERIHSRIAKARTIRNAVEAFEQASDSSESAGLGTITSILMLRGIGVPDKAYTVSVDAAKKETVAQVDIPLESLSRGLIDVISQTINRELGSLPPYPATIEKLERMLADGSMEFSQVAAVIQRDPALEAEILRVVNSAQYVLPRRVSNLQQALTLIGIRGLSNLLLFYGTQSVLSNRFQDKSRQIESMWDHAYRTASYAYNLARITGFARLADEVYLGGILHDIGKIILIAVNPEAWQRLTAAASKKGMTSDALEKIAMGASHATVGGQIATQWNFPTTLVQQITFHHHPFLAKDDCVNSTCIVSLADSLALLHDRKISILGIDEELLARFKISTVGALHQLEKDLDIAYRNQAEK